MRLAAPEPCLDSYEMMKRICQSTGIDIHWMNTHIMSIEDKGQRVKGIFTYLLDEIPKTTYDCYYLLILRPDRGYPCIQTIKTRTKLLVVETT